MDGKWNDGYVTDMEYTSGFYRDLTPGLLRMALLLHGVDTPSWDEAHSLRYLELGYGQGVSLNIHAAAVPGEFWGTDFNPNHALHAEHLARASGASVRLLNQSFAELAARDDLPQFDVIALHGVWSWISDANRGHILHILDRHLSMGGIVYISYNTLPGWAGIMPLRDVLALHANLLGSEAQNTQERISQAYAFTRALSDNGAGYFNANPSAKNMLEQMGNLPANYVAHEYFNRDWRPFYFADVAQALGLAKLSFVSSTRLLNEIDAVSLPEDGRRMLAGVNNPLLRETLRDYYMNQRFRADIFVKGAQRLTPRQQMERVSALRIGLAVQAESLPSAINSPMGECTLKEDVYVPLGAALADKDYAPKSVEELEDHPLLKDMDSAALIEALTVLTGAGFLHPAQDDARIQDARSCCDQLNTALLDRTRQGEHLPVLASPVLGGGLGSSRLEQLFLHSLSQGGADAADWGEDAWNTLAGRGERLLRDGEELSQDDARQEMITMAETFAEQRLPFLRAMGAVPPVREDPHRA